MGAITPAIALITRAMSWPGKCFQNLGYTTTIPSSQTNILYSMRLAAKIRNGPLLLIGTVLPSSPLCRWSGTAHFPARGRDRHTWRLILHIGGHAIISGSTDPVDRTRVRWLLREGPCSRRSANVFLPRVPAHPVALLPRPEPGAGADHHLSALVLPTVLPACQGGHDHLPSGGLVSGLPLAEQDAAHDQQ